MQQVSFHFSRSIDNIKILSWYKKPWAIWKIALKKRKFRRTFRSIRIFFLELQCLVDYSVHFLELSMFINSSLNILFDKVDSCEVETRKKYFVRYNLYPYFLKNCYRWPKLMTYIYTFREQVLYRKKWLYKFDPREKPEVYYKIHTWY